MAESKRLSSLNFETVGSIAAMVIGLSALFVAWDQAQIMRKQQHASVLPVVNVGGGFSTADNAHIMTISLSNDGIGPAMVESARLMVDGRYVEDWPDLRDRLLPAALHDGFHSNFDSAIGVLAAGETSNAVILAWPEGEGRNEAFETLKANVLTSVNDGTNFSVCYCSVFERCWRTAEDSTSKPQPVKECDDGGEDVVARLLTSLTTEPRQ